PPELTARYNKKVLTLEEIVQAHANSVYAQKYSIEVVGGRIKAVCNDCNVALSCGNLSDAKRHQCNKRPRSGQDATDADGASNDMPFERITACWNPAQPRPAQPSPAKDPYVDNPWLRDAFALAGIGMMSERSLLTSQLLLRYQEVQRKVAKQVAELEVTNTVAMGVSDGYKNKFGASLMDFSSLLPDGGRIFHDVKDVSDLKKDAVGIKDLLQRWADELRSAGHPVPVIKGWIMDNTSTNKRALQLMEDDDPDTINMGCAGQELQALALAEERRAQAQRQQQQQQAMLLQQQPGQVQQPGTTQQPGQVQQPGMAHPHGQDAEEWVLEVSRDNPQWTLGVLDLLRERLAKGYWPVMPAAYVLDGVNFAPPKDNLNASPQPPFGLLSPQEKEDAITTVARLSKLLRSDLTDSQVKQAVQREVDVLQLGGWGDSELERFAALLAPKPPDAAGRVAVEPVSMRRAFWGKAGPRGFPHLAVAASRLLGVHATSAASERNWSAWGRLFTSARTRLTLERAKMLIYIKANAGLGARHNTEAQLLARMGE
ncbi:hypothetical protein QJQ45_016977, partial [Haematococcus lacustris]